MLARGSLISTLAVVFLASPALSQPVSIFVPNYDFSSPYVANLPPYALAGASVWQQSPQPDWWTGGSQGWKNSAGVFINVPKNWIDNLVPSGGTTVHQQSAFMFSTPGLQLSQTLASTFQVGASYQLAVGIEGGGYGMPLGTPMEIGLYYPDALGNRIIVGTSTVLNDLALSGTDYITHLPDRHFALLAVTASDAWAGQTIGIALIQPNSGTTTGYWDISNVRLTSAFPSVWTGAAGNTNWSNSGNWTNGIPNFGAATAVINSPSASPLTITLDSPQTVGIIKLGSTSSAAVTISRTGDNVLTLDGWGSGATVSVLSGSHDIEAPVVLADALTINGSGTLAFGASSSITDNGSQYSLTMSSTDGTLILSGTNTYGGGTNILGGTLIATSPAALPDGSALSIGTSGAFAAPILGSSAVPPEQAVSNVPEPATFGLLAVSAALAVAARMRPRNHPHKGRE
jgi:autotransporter-associated beta strand protein